MVVFVHPVWGIASYRVTYLLLQNKREYKETGERLLQHFRFGKCCLASTIIEAIEWLLADLEKVAEGSPYLPKVRCTMQLPRLVLVHGAS
jgi:hypothetical protein